MGIDVAHLHSTTYSGLWTATIACWLAGVRRVYVTEHLAPYLPTPAWRRWERRAFNLLATRVIAVSEKNRAAYILLREEELSVKDAAMILGISMDAVKQRAHRADVQLRDAITVAGWASTPDQLSGGRENLSPSPANESPPFPQA